jgi:hypothetical protein
MPEISRRTLLAGAAFDPLAGDYRIIDSHVQAWKHDPEYPFAAGARVPARDATPEMLLELMKANGVSRTVIIQVIHYRYENRFLLPALERHRGVFQGMARVDPLDAAAPDHVAADRTGLPRSATEPLRGCVGRLVSRSADASVVAAMPGCACAHGGAGAYRPDARGGSPAGEIPRI